MKNFTLLIECIHCLIQESYYSELAEKDEEEEIFEKIDLLKQSQIKIPEIVQIIAQLKQSGKGICLQEWTQQEMMQEILKVCENEK